MDYIHGITNSNKLVQKKVNYFADYYSLAVMQMGKCQDFEIDNILSLMDKIIYQIEHNRHNCHNYILSHLSNPLLWTDNKYFKEFKRHHKILSKEFDDWRSADIKKFKAIDFSFALTHLKKFGVFLKKNMFDQSLKAIISFLKCNHKLEVHKADLQHYTKVIATELFFELKSKADIRDVFERIITRDPNAFPFSPAFLKKNKGNIEKAKIDFLKKQSLDDQFFGIAHFRNRSLIKRSYILRIGNVRCTVPLNTVVEGVNFYSNDIEKIKSIKHEVEKRKNFYRDPFFKNEFQLFAIIEHTSKTEKDHLFEALERVQKALNSLNRISDTCAFLDRHSYLFTKDFKYFGSSLSMGPIPRRITEIDMSRLISYDVNQFLGNKKIKSKRHFLSHEETYNTARHLEKLDSYWQYAENLLGKPLKSNFVKLIHHNVTQREKRSVEMHIKHCFSIMSSTTGSIGMSRDKQYQLAYELHNAKEYDYLTLKKLTSNEFIRDLINFYYTIETKTNSEYLIRQINEIYEQRNFIQHGGNPHTKAILKLNESVPMLFFEFRKEILNLMVKNPNKTFDEIKDIITKL